MRERRQEPRGPSSVPLEIYDPKGRVIVGEGRFVNFSIQGGLIKSENSLKSRRAVLIHLVPGAKSALEILGRVVWSRKNKTGFTYGIRFNSREPSAAH